MAVKAVVKAGVKAPHPIRRRAATARRGFRFDPAAFPPTANIDSRFPARTGRKSNLNFPSLLL
jgi:hypothetical protein